MAFAASPMPAADALAAWATIEDGLNYYAISIDGWAPVAAALGDEKLTELGILASIDDEDLKTARDSIKMSPIKKGAFTRLFGAVKTKFKFATKLTHYSTPLVESTRTSLPGEHVFANAVANDAAASRRLTPKCPGPIQTASVNKSADKNRTRVG